MRAPPPSQRALFMARSLARLAPLPLPLGAPMRSLACLAMLCALCVAPQALAQAPPVGDKPPPDQLLAHADATRT